MRNIIVYDDFFKDPDKVRAEVLKGGFQNIPGGTYPGNMSKPYVSDGILSLFSSLIGTEARLDPTKQNWFGHFRISTENVPFEQWIHTDPIAWSAIVYLNPEGTYPNGYGTAFWKHRETGWTSLPGTPGGPNVVDMNEDAIRRGYRDYQDYRRRIIYGDGLNESKWDLDLMVPGKYNRLIVFRPTLFHSHMPKQNFGYNDQTGRLIQLFFFDEARV